MSKKLISALLLICLLSLPLCAMADGTLNVFNYGEYIDEEVLYNFEKEKVRRTLEIKKYLFSCKI